MELCGSCNDGDSATAEARFINDWKRLQGNTISGNYECQSVAAPSTNCKLVCNTQNQYEYKDLGCNTAVLDFLTIILNDGVTCSTPTCEVSCDNGGGASEAGYVNFYGDSRDC